jgi:hypothetical protein
VAQKKRSSSLCHFFGGKLVCHLGVSGGYFLPFLDKIHVFSPNFGIFIEFGLKKPEI